MVVTPTFQLLEKKALPELLKLFKRWYNLGDYKASPVRKFEFSPYGDRAIFGHHNPDTPTTIHFGYAADPESLESMTAKAAWLDEAGQKAFKLASWEAIRRRLSIAQGRVLISTTPYDLGWLKQIAYDPWKRAREEGKPCEFQVVRFDSTENPQFPQEEFEAARASMPSWKFNLFYRGIFTRPAGQIYDSFIDELVPSGHKIPRFSLPDEWPRYMGLDFGGVNTAGMYYAAELLPPKPKAPPKRGQVLRVITHEEQELANRESGKYFAYREYLHGGRSAKEHCTAMLQGEPMIPVCCGGSRSEGQWRQEFRAGGLPVLPPPIRDVEVGIQRVYGAHRRGEIIVFSDLRGYLEQKVTYSRELDDQGEATEEIEDKATYHFLDAERYVIAMLKHKENRARAQLA